MVRTAATTCRRQHKWRKPWSTGEDARATKKAKVQLKKQLPVWSWPASQEEPPGGGSGFGIFSPKTSKVVERSDNSRILLHSVNPPQVVPLPSWGFQPEAPWEQDLTEAGVVANWAPVRQSWPILLQSVQTCCSGAFARSATEAILANPASVGPNLLQWGFCQKRH